MSVLYMSLMLLHTTMGITTINGVVVNPEGVPLAHSQVFLELGLGDTLLDTFTDESGHFSFEELSPGPAGIFAIAPGYGFEGQHLTVAVGDTIAPLRLVLHPASQIRGKISSHAGKAVDGARITRIGVKGTHKVGIPLAKLKQYGYVEPQSDEGGEFLLENVPAGCTVDLKVGHSSFAQEGVPDVPAGAENVEIILYPGVLLEGTVIDRSSQSPVAQLSILIQNAQPPNDTALARSNLQGRFSIRLKPGVYTYQANGGGMRSPGWERLTITGERNVENLRLAVAGTGQIRGNVRDAISGDPIRDVRISLTTNGVPAAVARTGPQGDFLFAAGEGENIVRVAEAPGFFPPEAQDMKISIAEGVAVDLPGMWLKPLPAYKATIVDQDGTPVPGAVVSVLRPAQFGWYIADQDGQVTFQIQTFPEVGGLLARAEHPKLDHGALFTVEKHQEGVSTVQLYPLASVSGKVVNSRGSGVSGATVGAFFPGESATDATLLWQTTSRDDGTFLWEAVVPGVPQRCAARIDDGANGESETFNLAPSESKQLVDLRVEGGKDSDPIVGTRPTWYAADVQCGILPEAAECASRPALLFYASASMAPAIAESALQIQKAIAIEGLIVAVVAEGPVNCDGSTPIPILSGTRPSTATTLVIDSEGKVTLESAGVPPLSVLRRLR